MNKYNSIRKKLFTFVSVAGTIYIVLHLISLVYSNDMKYKWDSYNQHIKTKNDILAKIKTDFGYGGAIHNFKNYLIRANENYLMDFDKSFNRFLNHKKEYQQIAYTTRFEIAKLNDIQQIFEQYKVNIQAIKYLREQGKSIKEIDSIVKIDDSLAIKAMNDLAIFFENARTNTSQQINQIISFLHYISLFVVFTVLIIIIVMSVFFERTIMKPLIQIENGLISFFKFLSNKKNIVEPIDIISKDEFGVMAKSINKNIILATDLHKDVHLKNAELENLIQSYGQNVIASKTDLNGIITYASEAFANISGYTIDELIGKPHSIVRHPDLDTSTFKSIWRTIRKQKVWKGEIKNQKKDGGYYLVKATITPLYDEEQNHIGYSAIREDITDHVQVIELNKQLDVYKNHLEERVKKATTKIEDLMVEIEETQKEVVFTMGAIGERRSEETGNHVKRVAEYSKLFALYYGLDEKDAEMLKQASPMHDIGKVGIPDSILNKAGALTPQERILMQEHCMHGYNMLKSSNRELLKIAAIVALEHHEKYDGTGYPKGLKGEEINIYGRITAIADVFDALGSDRVYKKAWRDETIFNLFKEERGKHFDPKLVDIFFEHLEEFLSIRKKFHD